MTEKIPGCVWTNEAVTLLLSLYLREKQKDRPVKLKKKEIWKYICAELWSRGLICSWQECDKKYRNLKQTFVRNLKQAGKKECRWMFFPIMLEINKHEPFVNEMVTSAFAHNATSSNTSTSDFENDDDCSGDARCIKLEEQSVKYVPNSDTRRVDIPYYSPSKSIVNQIALHQPFLPHPTRLSKSPSPQRQNSPQHSPLSLKSASSPQLHQLHKNEIQQSGAQYSETYNYESVGPQNKKIKTVEPDTPPIWFQNFLDEYKKSEDKKIQQIKDLCDEVRRTNDIEHQRNVILNEKNDLLKNLIDYMSTK